MPNELIFEKSRPGRKASSIPACDVPVVNLKEAIGDHLMRKDVPLPEVAEVDLIRHYVNLSRKNFGVDIGFYPLGSCTMKYNPKINEDMSRLPGFTGLHPYVSEKWAQGNLQLMYELEQSLCEIFGMAQFTLQPAAGAHGELTGVMVMRKYFEMKGEKRTKMLIPDAAHGTNPASSALCGFEAVTVRSNAEGGVDIDHLRELMTEEVVGLMLTNPNTLGLFERNIEAVAKIIHDKGGLLYCDGANSNAYMGITRPGDLGFDVIQLNLHKTFSTPHGCGGPGSGPVGVHKKLVDYLPIPRIIKKGDVFSMDYNYPHSIGRVKAFYGNFNVMVKAYTYIRALGAEGLKSATENAVLNANYIRVKLEPYYDLPYKRICMHECVFSGSRQVNESGVHTLDIAKRLLDYGFHPPTIYFPLIVSEAIMIEPTETESLETLDAFCEVMIKIAKEAKEDPELLHNAPLTTPVRRLDDVMAARQPNVRWTKE
ncbi:MAG: aminomethyl-transferring glycine dehydrogenase subunit GcvPB [Gammaproteobacteria bacterium]|nr:aminomethyl-transferring glycine dehydrogenase subunit GcvPB [Gammaproteobacteria bacterium]